MNKLLFIALTTMLLAGCAREFQYVDYEWGKAQQASWNMQVANPDYKYAATNPVGIEGVTAEEVMNAYNQSFAEKSADTKIFEFGVTGSE